MRLFKPFESFFLDQKSVGLVSISAASVGQRSSNPPLRPTSLLFTILAWIKNQRERERERDGEERESEEEGGTEGGKESAWLCVCV